MDFGLAVIGALLVGLPLFAVLFARRLPPPRRRATRADPLWELARRHSLIGTDLLRVQDAVAKGQRDPDARLRPAAVEYADLVVGLRSPRRLVRFRSSRWRFVALGGYGALVLVVAVKTPMSVFSFVMPMVLVATQNVQRRQARRALALIASRHRSPYTTPALADERGICRSR